MNCLNHNHEAHREREKMSKYMKLVRFNRKPDKKGERSYSWETHLRAHEEGKTEFVPADAFSKNLIVDFSGVIKEGVIFETVIHDYDHVVRDVEPRWFARVEKTCGYRVLAQFIGCSSKFWIHILSDEVHGFANAPATVEHGLTIPYIPPLSVNEEYCHDLKNYIYNCIDHEIVGEHALSPLFDENRKLIHTPRFRVGQRLELLNYQKSTEIRVARIKEICGRRINALVMKEDYPLGKGEDYPTDEDDRQFENKAAQYWIDEGSFFIFPVGFAAVNGYSLRAMPDYIKHTKKIAEAIGKGEEPQYKPEDITFKDLEREHVDEELMNELKVGQKFELIDPLAQQFNSLHVASILSFCKTPGFIIVGMDGPDALEDSFPIYIMNLFMFPVGYSETYGLTLEKPDGFEDNFDWAKYLKSEKAEALPLDSFRPMPSRERLEKFQVGMRLEAADMCENQFICPATIKSVHGRLINVNFDGWDSEFDELYDIDSHDILPIGWCELHNYVLQPPKRYT
uniref:Tudor domain-containing protein n=1 Tax=Caenorhabditis tropicalis TaxID=1561998 RepID=A0A1I7UM03_9PELO